jgi:hypothetical protein
VSFRAHTEKAFRLTGGVPVSGRPVGGTSTSHDALPGGARVDGATRRDPAAGNAARRDLRSRKSWRAWTVFDYRRYATFSWDWSWRRSVLFATFGCVFGVWEGATNGVMLDNWRIGFTLGVGTIEEMIVAMCLAPLAASWVRSRGWPMKREMIGVFAAVILGVAASDACQLLGTAYATRVVLPSALQTRVVAENYLVRYHIMTSSPLSVLGASVLFMLLSGGLALPTYLGEQRRLIEEAHEREVGELQLLKQETDLQLLVLQAQIEPHFLFNTLASLRSLLRQDVDRAEAMIDALVKHLRAAMPVFRENSQRPTLSEQLRICSSYLELMRVRLPDRLTYAIDVPDALRSAAFPPLILLTLVENAVKHGIEPKPGPGHIRIDARREYRADGAHITVSVTDNGAGLSAGLGHGVGLSNIRTQLALRYRDRAALSLIGTTQGGVVASIDIPEDETGNS